MLHFAQALRGFLNQRCTSIGLHAVAFSRGARWVTEWIREKTGLFSTVMLLGGYPITVTDKEAETVSAESLCRAQQSHRDANGPPAKYPHWMQKLGEMGAQIHVIELLTHETISAL